jgi:GxxExxY protein
MSSDPIADHEPLTERIIGCAIAVHNAFGPGLLESVYRKAFVIELETNGLTVAQKRRVTLTHRGVATDWTFWWRT